MILGLVLASGPLGSTCNECTKARYQLTVQAGDASTDQISTICGNDFICTLPPEILQRVCSHGAFQRR
jgi:hypothetical protein